MSEHALQELFNEVYGTAQQRTANLINKYGTLYNLPKLEKQWQVDPTFFRHCQGSVNFVVAALYNDKKEFFIIRSLSKLSPAEPVGWKLPGGPILDSKHEFVEEAVHRIVRQETSLEIDELEPLAVLNNLFRWNAHEIPHHGIAFMGRARGKIKMRPDALVMLGGTGLEKYQDPLARDEHKIEAQFTSEIPEKMAFSNREIVEMAQMHLESVYLSKPVEPPHEEIDASRKVSIRCLRTLHRLIVSRFLYLLASKPVRRRVVNYVGQPSSVLDASAGDDVMLCQIAKDFSPELCVANDISWLEMEPARKQARKRNLHIIFTNHNIANLPFKLKFDVAICKNTLHHSRTGNEAISFLRSIEKVAHRAIIVDIEDPQRRLHAKLFNRYYTLFHGDRGHYFYSQDQFNKLIKLAYPRAILAFDKVDTIKGRYMFAVIDFQREITRQAMEEKLGIPK